MSGEHVASERAPAVGEAARRAIVVAITELCLRVAAAGRRDRIEAVHKLRVSSRRLDATLDAFRDALRDRRPRRAATRAAADLRERLGAVRDLDVRSGLLDELAADVPAAAPAIAALQGEVRARRPAAEAALDEALQNLDADLLAHLADVVARARGSREARGAIRRRLARRFDRLAAAAVAARDHAAGPLHEARKAAKRLRYLLEVAGPLALDAPEPPIATLKALQDLLGRIHDLDVIADRLRAQDAAAPPLDGAAALAAHLAALRHQLAAELDPALAPARLDELAHALGLA